MFSFLRSDSKSKSGKDSSSSNLNTHYQKLSVDFIQNIEFTNDIYGKALSEEWDSLYSNTVKRKLSSSPTRSGAVQEQLTLAEKKPVFFVS